MNVKQVPVLMSTVVPVLLIAQGSLLVATNRCFWNDRPDWACRHDSDRRGVPQSESCIQWS